ncbi:ADP-ribosyl cyclase/cyclic ADP-ribose hydrolase 1-like [Erinaceus europaeus]|uniref:ADP-ribosyl cyclase/cyclic ADP-ribose hydrolase 1 n=1 Tax=Erinaceus europaeus TaxID=9365 RepID=A0ABM3X632_ERIEU|nr:ADP-ribosyl cyclase/cyclic ADP-ribose hydrolase 1-like [Erinaceus europaeus]
MSAHLVYIQMTPSQEDLGPDPESLADNDPVDQGGCCPQATTLLERKESSLGSFWKALSFRVCFILVVLVLVVVGVILWLFLWTPSQVSQTPQIWKGSGTTSNFSNILLQRCFSYVRTRGSELRHKDCHQILEAFLSAFLSKNPCEVTEQDYARLLQLTEQKIPCNQGAMLKLLHRRPENDSQ